MWCSEHIQKQKRRKNKKKQGTWLTLLPDLQAPQFSIYEQKKGTGPQFSPGGSSAQPPWWLGVMQFFWWGELSSTAHFAFKLFLWGERSSTAHFAFKIFLVGETVLDHPCLLNCFCGGRQSSTTLGGFLSFSCGFSALIRGFKSATPLV